MRDGDNEHNSDVFESLFDIPPRPEPHELIDERFRAYGGVSEGISDIAAALLVVAEIIFITYGLLTCRDDVETPNE